MKLAFLAPLVTPILPHQHGGSQAMVADLATEMTSRGHDVVVFASRGSRIDGVELFELDVDSGELQDVLQRAGQPSLITRALRRSFALAYKAIGEGFDVVHNHGFDPPAITEAPMDTAVVHTLHLPPTPQMVDAVSTRQIPRPTFVCVSQTQAQTWREHVHIDEVVLNGVPIGQIPWEKHGSPFVMFAGRLSREKGVHTAIDAAAASGVPIHVAGSVYDQDYFEKEILPRAAWENVTMCGHLSRSDLWDRMSHAQAVILPATWDEPFGMVAAEANAAGAPVVASRKGGLTEIVEEGVTGFLLDTAEIAAWADAIDQAAMLDRERIRRHAAATLSLTRMASSYERLYEHVRSVTRASL